VLLLPPQVGSTTLSPRPPPTHPHPIHPCPPPPCVCLCLSVCRFVCSKRACPALLSSPIRGRRATLTPLLLLQVTEGGRGGNTVSGGLRRVSVCVGRGERGGWKGLFITAWLQLEAQNLGSLQVPVGVCWLRTRACCQYTALSSRFARAQHLTPLTAAAPGEGTQPRGLVCVCGVCACVGGGGYLPYAHGLTDLTVLLGEDPFNVTGALLGLKEAPLSSSLGINGCPLQTLLPVQHCTVL